MTKQIYREEFETFTDFIVAVTQATFDDRQDPRLEISAAATGLGENIPSDGGFTVPLDFASEIWLKIYDHGQLISRCAKQPVTTGSGISIPAINETTRADGSRFGGLRLYWSDEAATVTAEKPKYALLSLNPKKLMGLSYATDELLADAPALAAFLRRAFIAEATFEIENQIVTGTGAGRPLGVLNSGALISVAKESGQAANTVLAANLKNMAQRLWSASHANGVWLMGNDAFAQIADAQFANGVPVVSYGPSGGKFILGMPLILSEYNPAIGDVGDVLLGDFSQYLLAERELDFISSLHVRFLNAEGVFKFRWRIDGQPGWATPITPRNSSTTQSPFVVTAERA